VPERIANDLGREHDEREAAGGPAATLAPGLPAAAPPRPWEWAIIPRFTAPPVGMGNREWGIGEEDLPTPHPTAFFSLPPHLASSFPIPTIPHSRLPIPRGGAGRRREGGPLSRPWSRPLYALVHLSRQRREVLAEHLGQLSGLGLVRGRVAPGPARIHDRGVHARHGLRHREPENVVGERRHGIERPLE